MLDCRHLGPAGSAPLSGPRAREEPTKVTVRTDGSPRFQIAGTRWDGREAGVAAVGKRLARDVVLVSLDGGERSERRRG